MWQIESQIFKFELTQVVAMSHRRTKQENKIPFDLSIPNAETTKAILEARKRKNVVKCKDINEMFKRLGLK